jgi:3-methyladenine DNA glycosylase AlkD
MLSSSELSKSLHAIANKEIAVILQRFFKTGPGQYGEGDKFLGIKVPQQRELAKRFKDLSLIEVEKSLQSVWHEERLTALLILTYKFPKAVESERAKIYKLYIKNLKYINNWDLVDLSAPNIVGTYLLDKPRDILYKLIESKHLWSRRVAVLATFTFLRNKQYADIITFAEKLLNDKEDLMHKASGWMLREMGKRDLGELRHFLDKHVLKMPRTMLRYAIEKLEEEERLRYLRARV